MKIAHVTATFPPYWAGTGNVAYHNARLMQERGHEVTVFTAKTANDGELKFSFNVERLPVVFRIGNAPFTPSLLGKLRGFDLIHLHYPFIFGAELALLASKRYQIPLVLTYHNQLQEQHPIKRTIFGTYNLAAEPTLLNQATRLFAVQEEHLTSIHPRFKGHSKLVELPNGVDTRVFLPHCKSQVRTALKLPEDVPIALFVGALDQAHRFKNVDGLLKAFAKLPIQNARLLIVGDGDLRPSLESLAASLGLTSRVHFLGKRPPEALPPVFSAADVTVLPSTSVESFGIVLVESMACGTPVIAADLPGVRALVDPGVDGLRISASNEEALIEALHIVLSSPADAIKMGKHGCRKVQQHYDWKVIGRILDQAYFDITPVRDLM
jgi:glycosyltransferase involved in cell wall biosynthesis